MTQQEQDLLRIAAWDRFNASKTKLTALKSKVHGWAQAIQALAGVCEHFPLGLSVDHYNPVPSKDEFQRMEAEIDEATKVYQRARQEAAAFGFPVGEDDSITGL